MLSVGIDLVENRRIKKSMERERFCRTILGQDEYRLLSNRGFPVESVAASFCAKEAFGKALGTGIRGFALAEVELMRSENGAPYLQLSGRAVALAQERHLQFAVSVTHTREYASAVVIGEPIPDKQEAE